VVIWLQRGANDLYMVQLMPLVPAYPGSPRTGWVKQVFVCLPVTVPPSQSCLTPEIPKWKDADYSILLKMFLLAV